MRFRTWLHSVAFAFAALVVLLGLSLAAEHAGYMRDCRKAGYSTEQCETMPR